LHDFVSDREELRELARHKGVVLRDVRKTPPRGELHAFSGKIRKVTSVRLAVLGTDAAVGKRTTAWVLVDALRKRGFSAELVGTGQTAWLQGVEYGILLDSLINDFVTGKVEHAVFQCWQERNPDVILIEGQGALLNPAFPGGLEIIAATDPHGIILQHAPGRRTYEDLPEFPMHPLSVHIQAHELISSKSVLAVTLNHHGFAPHEMAGVSARIAEEVGKPVVVPLLEGVDRIVSVLEPLIQSSRVKNQ